MKFLQLTDSTEGTSIWVNMHLVTTIVWDGKAETTDLFFVDGSSMEVAERPEEILRLITPLTN